MENVLLMGAPESCMPFHGWLGFSPDVAVYESQRPAC